MQFKHWSALGPSQPWSPHSGWHGPGEIKTTHQGERFGIPQALLPGCSECTLPRGMDMWKGLETLHLSNPLSIILQIFYISSQGAVWLWVLVSPPAYPPSMNPTQASPSCTPWGSFEREARPSPWGRTGMPTHARAGAGGGQRSFFYSSDSCTTNLWWEPWDGEFCCLLISLSCCPGLATGNAPPSPP